MHLIQGAAQEKSERSNQAGRDGRRHTFVSMALTGGTSTAAAIEEEVIACKYQQTAVHAVPDNACSDQRGEIDDDGNRQQLATRSRFALSDDVKRIPLLVLAWTRDADRESPRYVDANLSVSASVGYGRHSNR